MRKLDHWIAFYKDGSKHEGITEKDFQQLPIYGFQTLLILYDDGTRQALNGDDHFFFIDGVIGSTSDKDALLRRIPSIKFGEWLNHEVYEKIQVEVQRLGLDWHKKYYDHPHNSN